MHLSIYSHTITWMPFKMSLSRVDFFFNNYIIWGQKLEQPISYRSCIWTQKLALNFLLEHNTNAWGKLTCTKIDVLLNIVKGRIKPMWRNVANFLRYWDISAHEIDMISWKETSVLVQTSFPLIIRLTFRAHYLFFLLLSHSCSCHSWDREMKLLWEGCK